VTPSATRSATVISTPQAGGGLASAGYYGVLASTFTRNGGISQIAGDAGYSILSGSGTHQASGSDRTPAPPQAGLDQAAAAAWMNALACDFSFAAGAVDLASDSSHGSVGSFSPGTYCVTGAMSIGGGGTIVLNGKGTYVFRSTGAFNSSANSQVLLSGGANACDVFWLPAGAATLGANSVFAGTLIDDAGITVGAGTSWRGRALAFAGTVTLDTDSILALSCAPPSGAFTGPNPPGLGRTFAFPSPASGAEVNFAYAMRRAGRVEIRVMNEVGDLVASLREERPAGPQRSRLSIHEFASGVYLYKVFLNYDDGDSDSLELQKFAVAR
jgi:hypothetical protein